MNPCQSFRTKTSHPAAGTRHGQDRLRCPAIQSSRHSPLLLLHFPYPPSYIRASYLPLIPIYPQHRTSSLTIYRSLACRSRYSFVRAQWSPSKVPRLRNMMAVPCASALSTLAGTQPSLSLCSRVQWTSFSRAVSKRATS